MWTYLVITRQSEFILAEGRGIPDAMRRAGLYGRGRVANERVWKILPCIRGVGPAGCICDILGDEKKARESLKPN